LVLAVLGGVGQGIRRGCFGTSMCQGRVRCSPRLRPILRRSCVVSFDLLPELRHGDECEFSFYGFCYKIRHDVTAYYCSKLAALAH